MVFSTAVLTETYASVPHHRGSTINLVVNTIHKGKYMFWSNYFSFHTIGFGEIARYISIGIRIHDKVHSPRILWPMAEESHGGF